MQKVVSINLNGRAYQVEEQGYAALVAYLERAERLLADNPDRAEIVADLEQAIADKCDALIGPHKTVVSTPEVERIVREMGPVEAEPDDPGGGEDARRDSRRRLYQVREGAMLSGVCNGLGAYFDVDPTLVRIAFVVLAFVTSGVWVAVYGVLMIVIPHANTPEERAAAAGAPFNAQEVIDRAMRTVRDRLDELGDGPLKGLGGRRGRRRRHGWFAAAPGVPWPPVPPPAFDLVRSGLLLLLAVAGISIVNSRALLGWPVPADVPTWAALLAVIVVYNLLALPLLVGHPGWAYPAVQPASRAVAFGHVLVRIAFLVFVVWLVFQNLPEVREFMQRAPGVLREFVRDIRSVF
jgi:phage shock protein PspC (stress-responsive transcriptional regulator)